MSKDQIQIIAEIGINHNGDLNIAKQLIDKAKATGFDYVKFQKRSPEVCVPEYKKTELVETPWGNITYLAYKHKIEFGKEEFDQIDEYCKAIGIKWFCSVWDLESAMFMRQFSDLVKIPSALITDFKLIAYCRKHFNTVIISTGMSTENQIEQAVHHAQPDVIMHTNSTYPCPVEHLNLNYINWLQQKYNAEIGYSGHEYGLVTTFATVPLGVKWIERHITLDRTMWGSDQIASVEPIGMLKLVKGVRAIEAALGGHQKRDVLPGEELKLKSLRKSFK